MPRYTKQRAPNNCGPAAILNALKWAGADVSHADYMGYLTELASCGPLPRGTWHATFDRALRVAGEGLYSVRRIHFPTLGEIEAHLQGEGALVLNYREEDRWTISRHFTLMVGVSPSHRSFYIVNRHHGGKALRKINRGQFKKWDLRFQRTDRHYKAWFLIKEGE